MNSRERMALAMCHRTPDQVPVMCQLSIGHYNLNGGYRPHEIWYESEAYAEAMLKLAKRYRFDGVLVGLPGRPPGYLDENLASLRESADGEWLTWRSGDRTFLPWDDMPQHHSSGGDSLQRAYFGAFDPDRDIDHIGRYRGYVWAVHHIEGAAGRCAAGMVRGELPDFLYRTFDMVKARAGGELSVHGSLYSPLTLFFELFGYEEALIALATDPAKAHAVLARLTEGVLGWALSLVRRGADALSHSSAFVGAPFFSRRMYREFVVPYEGRINRAIRAVGGTVYTHTCGRIGDRLDLLAETKTMGIAALDPPPLGDGDLAAAKRDYGDVFFFRGNVNSVALLRYATRQEVLKEVSRVLRVGMPGGSYILSTSCSVAPRVEPWKLELFADVSESIGHYP